MKRAIHILTAAASFAVAAAASAGAECVIPSKPGGAMDLTCKLAQKALPDTKLKLAYLPGGIGAVAWHTLISQRRAEPDTLVAFSGGSLLNLAEGKFGKATFDDVRWVAALGVDYGMIAVRADSPWHSLGQLMDAIRRDPQQVLIGVSGTIGSQDWMKIAMLARRAGVEPRRLRFVALEGGGETFTAMSANFVQVISGDASEAVLYSGPGNVRVLAVLSEHRLAGVLAAVPTAREQGYDIVWPVIRGVWMGPDVPEADYRRWVDAFARMQATPEFAQLRQSAGLHPFSLTGDALTRWVKQAITDYNRQAREFNLVR
ncbi:tripartite tricarboxylate transporter substrate binding protein [Massilia sp. Root335]|jgi:putative tricarboxylic transport membrane protein|uniref:tripartite tricarboxylate transporter substrate binding protein n=1 Tax=Massilia sp. Root335 TaxID=1736517 RepID=UPI0006F7C516|nr:tripartite tricarboxylate transporter substrate-binding protein [Massilia sp. Root335]KQV49009.1 tricarboxylate transporter [Massilia sp. Root335]